MANYEAPFTPVQPQPPQDDTVSFGEWIGSLLLMMVPIANIILAFVWAFGSGAKPSKRNFFRAYLLLMAIGIVLSIIFSATLASLIGGLVASSGGVY